VARIKHTSIEAVKAAADMVAVVAERTQLRRAGARFTGRCPFHEERTPSFSVNAHDKLFYCFGCGKGGDLVSFVELTESVDFAGAIESLASRFGVQLEYEESSPQWEAERERSKRLFDLLGAATTFYERHLWESPSGSAARDYLAGRGLGEDVCREFRLGLAPGGMTLARRALQKGFTSGELAAAGLANRRGNDYFSQRLLFPLADARGRVRGFQARKLREDDPLRAKYVNSPEGELFRKGDLLYGLDRSRSAIAKQGRACVVEGNTDVLALRQAGFEPVVASMGTALTERQLKELSRLTRTLYLCFDGDAAGEAATLRGMELAAAQGFEVFVLTLPPGLDPADLAEGFEARLSEAVTYALHRVKMVTDHASSKESALREVRELVAGLDRSDADWQQAVQYAADRLALPSALIGSVPSTPTRPEAPQAAKDPGHRLERDALAGCLAHRELLKVLGELDDEHFDSELHRRLRAFLLEAGPADEQLVALLAELDARAASEGIDEETAEQLLLRLRERRLRRELDQADETRFPELQQALARVRTAFREFV